MLPRSWVVTPVPGQGTTRIITTGPEGEVGCVMHDVLFIPGFTAEVKELLTERWRQYDPLQCA